MTKPIAFTEAHYIDPKIPIGRALERLASNFEIFEAALTELSQVGADTVLTHDAHDTIMLKNVALANLRAEGSSFVAAQELTRGR